MMQTIRWGIIGCGDVTEVKSGPGLQKAHPVMNAFLGEICNDNEKF